MDPERESFAHGTYGDDSGVTFNGPPEKGFFFDTLAVSNRFIVPLFDAILVRGERAAEFAVPKVVREWNDGGGWGGQLLPNDVAELTNALASVVAEDIASHRNGADVAKCLRCALAISEFLTERVGRGLQVYIEPD